MQNRLHLPQAGKLSALWLLFLLSAMSSLNAAPYLPASDGEIVEKIPRYIAAKSAAPDLASSIALASQLLDTAKTQSDPRAVGIALSVLSPWESQQSSELNLVRAGLLQYQHRFSDAIGQLTLPASGRTPDPRALLLRANINLVQGRYSDAERDCSALLRYSDTAVSATCLSIAHSLSGKLAQSYSALIGFSQRFNSSDPAIQHWMSVSLAEMAIRLGKSPLPHWYTARLIEPVNVPQRLEESRWLIENGRYAEAVVILLQLPVSLQRDVLLERTSESKNIAALQSRFELAELADGENAHAREYSEFLLYVAKDPSAAAEKSLVNWRQQREPIDLLLLSQAAQQSGNQAAWLAAKSFREETQIEDLRLPNMQVSQ